MNVALTISAGKIKVLSLKGRQVKKWASFDLESGLVRDGLILQPQAVGEAINSLFKSTGLPRDRVIASVAGMSFTYRFISLPRLKPALVEESVLRAARKEISLPLEELYLSWQAIPGQGDEQSYFVLGVPRNLIDPAVQTLKIAGVPPYLMDLRALALARTAQQSDAIVVNLDADCSDIVFITGGLPTVIHSMSPRGEGATLEDNIRRLADELTKTAAFYQSSHPEANLSSATPLLLSGDLTAETPAGALLHAEVEYPIEPLYPPVQYPDNLPAASYTAAIGLALKEATKKTPPRWEQFLFHDINVNILAGKFRKPKARPVPARYVWLGVLLAIFLVLLFPLYQARQHIKTDNLKLENDAASIQRELDFADIAGAASATTEASINSITAASAAVKNAIITILGTRGDYGASLRLVTGAIPAHTLITSIEVGRDAITIRGETDSVFSVVAYATALEAADNSSKVRITSLDEADAASVTTNETGTPAGVKAIIFEILVQKPAPENTVNK
jgi:Tfp pilus assembly protein PilN